jgi:hypothetical protein
MDNRKSQIETGRERVRESEREEEGNREVSEIVNFSFR